MAPGASVPRRSGTSWAALGPHLGRPETDFLWRASLGLLGALGRPLRLLLVALGPLLGRQDDVQIHSGFLLFRVLSGLSLRRRAPDIARLIAGVADAASWRHPARKSGALVEAPCTFLIKVMLSLWRRAHF